MKEYVLQVMVRDNNVDQALRVLKKKMQRKGVFREMKRRRFYEKPSETFGPGAGRSAAGGAQARSQEGPARGTSSGSARQEAANRQTVRTQWTVLGHGPAPGSHVGVVGLAS
jgi:ribosomal protein S21